MLTNRYNNFVRPSSPTESSNTSAQLTLNGEEAKRLYLEEIKGPDNPVPTKRYTGCEIKKRSSRNVVNLQDITNKELFMSVQNNEVQTLIHILDTCPSLLNTTDEFGWSLLMIACQANAVETVRELVKRGADISVRDKAGNSARSLVIKNRNLVLADILLSYKTEEPVIHKITNSSVRKAKVKVKRSYLCDICNKEFPSREEHLSSTIHNISASKDKKIPSNYVIPQWNKGYQIMLRVGWDRESGLGPDGSGKKYPIKTVQKKDRKGLGHDKRKKIEEERKDIVKNVNRKLLDRQHRNSRNMEIHFRRQFY